MRQVLVVVFVLFVFIGSADAQPPPGTPAPGVPGGQATPTRAGAGRPDATATGTAVLRGYVVAADTGEPVRRAIVRAMAPNAGGSMTSTDEEGRFEFRDLAAGRYMLSASKGGYVGVQYGQRRPNQSGTPLELRDGEVIEKIAIALPPGSVITGRIFDDFGDPVSGVMVTAMRHRSMGGNRQLGPVGGEGGMSRTDDQGHFRLYGLAPGDYYVSAAPQSAMLSPDLRDDTVGASQTYYPGTANAAEAAAVRVQLGQETAGVTFPIVMARMARVSGRVVNSRGEIASGVMVRLVPATGLMGATMRGSPVDPKGMFSIANVPPGEHVLQVSSFGPTGPGPEAAVMPITVGNADLDGILLTTTTGGTARGRVIVDSGTAPPFGPEAVIVNLIPARPGMMATGNPLARVEADWTFEGSGLFESRIVYASVKHPDWMLKAIRLNGRDVTDEPIDFGPGRAVEDIEVEFTDRLTRIEGVVTDERGEPVVDATLMVFSGDPARWTAVLPRFVRWTRPDAAGRYEIRSMPPHADYRLIAVRDVSDEELRDPEFLASVREQALRFSLGEGETRIENVRVRD